MLSSSLTTRGVALAGLLAAAMGAGCIRFGAAVVGGDAAPDTAREDVSGEGTATASDASDAPLLDHPGVPVTDVPLVLDAPWICVQNDDCVDSARPFCDVSAGRCVGCLTSPDTCPIRRFCDAITSTCRDGCLADRDCVPTDSADAGVPPRRCDRVRHICGE